MYKEHWHSRSDLLRNKMSKTET